MNRRLVLWRHGRTRWNAEGRAQGHSDVELDELGRAQAEAAAPVLASLAPTGIVSSDLRRAAETAQPLARLTGLVPTLDPRLREIQLGEREGLTVPEARVRFPQEMARLAAGEDVRVPGAETYAETAVRFADALGQHVQAMADGDLLVVVSHGGAMHVGACRFLGLPESCWPVLGGFDNCHWAWLGERRHGWAVEGWNVGGLPLELEGGDRVGG